MECPKLVVVDLDGTVVKHSTTRTSPSAVVIKALAAVRAAQVPVAVATGRALWSALPTIAELGLQDGLISAAHGAITYDLATANVIDSQTINPTLAVESFASIDDSLGFGVELGTQGWRHTHHFKRDFETMWADVVDIETLCATETTRLAVRMPSAGDYIPGQRCPRATKLSREVKLDASRYCLEIGFNGWIDVGPPAVSKATGVSAIAAHFGVQAHETVVFGDAGNDLSMFGWAGHSVAMGQSCQEVLSAADEIAPSVDQDGVAEVLRRWFA